VGLLVRPCSCISCVLLLSSGTMVCSSHGEGFKQKVLSCAIIQSCPTHIHTGGVERSHLDVQASKWPEYWEALRCMCFVGSLVGGCCSTRDEAFTGGLVN